MTPDEKSGFPADVTFANAPDPTEVFTFQGVLTQANGNRIGIYRSLKRPEVVQTLEMNDAGEPTQYNVANRLAEIAESRMIPYQEAA